MYLKNALISPFSVKGSSARLKTKTPGGQVFFFGKFENVFLMLSDPYDFW